MINYRVIIVYVLFCISALSAKFVIKNATFTQYTFLELYNPAILKLNNSLVTVTKSNTTINVTTTAESFKPCNIYIDSKIDHVNTKIQARALGNGKIILWGYHIPVNDVKVYKTVSYVIFIIEPMSCTIQRLAKIQDDVPNSWLEYEGYVIPYQDTFDVFFKTQHTCSPCRFNDKGEKIEVVHKLVTESDDEKNFFIDTVKENDPSQGYFYAYQYKNLTGIMFELTEKFEPIGIREGLISARAEAFSAVKGYRTVCLNDDPIMLYSGAYYQSPFCYLFDTKKHKIVASGSMHHPVTRYPTHTATQTYENGNAIVALAHIYPAPKPAEIEIQVLISAAPGLSDLDMLLNDQEVSEPIKFQEISGNYPFEMYCIRIEEAFCLVTREKKEIAEDYNKPEVKLTVKCMVAHF